MPVETPRGLAHKAPMRLPDLPISEALPDLLTQLRARGCAVLQAPPGAGKTTVVPLAMLDAGLVQGRIVMLEPRRLAARASAERMAETLGEKPGETVGYRMRGQSRIGKRTRIEVVTEGVFTRMIQADPALSGIGAVIFDEFHERALNADLGLALAVEARAALRPDLALLVMSATLDAAPVAEMLDAPVITSAGRAFPVETRWLDRPLDKSRRFEDAVATLVRRALDEASGGVLVFLPGQGEIRRVQGLLRDGLPPGCEVLPLFGAMDFAAQRAALAPGGARRKIVLATSIAETSLTIPDIAVVVDGGRARRARFDPASGMSRLVTERVSRAEADQRRGRAGRVAAGLCYRLWTRGEEGGMASRPPAEIEAGDLAPLVLELAAWGARGAEGLAFVTPPNPGAFAGAQALLRDLGALDADNAITAHGRAISAMPLHPRLAHMLALGGPDAPLLAALLEERDPLRGGSCDLGLRRDALMDPARFPAAHRPTIERIRAEARRLQRHAGDRPATGWARLAALAYPDRIGLRRPGDAPRWVLSGGKGAAMAAGDPLAGARLIVATNLDGDTTEARIRQAITISEADLRAVFADRIRWEKVCEWSRRDRRVLARERERLGALVLAERNWKSAPDQAVVRAALQGLRDIGLPLSPAARRFMARVELVRRRHPDLPAFTEAALLDSLQDWLAGHLPPVRTEAELRALDLLPALRARLDWDQAQLVDRLAPARFTTPTGRRIAIDYAGQAPEIAVRLQEMFGTGQHPSVAGQPLRVTLLSPANRPVQTTMDLPGFWTSTYADVRKDMRGRYPKHPWPEDPLAAAPTRRAKPRKP